MKSEDLIRAIIAAIGDDPDREGVQDTPERVVRSWAELFAGYHEDPRLHLRKRFSVGETTSPPQMVFINGIDVVSTCEHHMLPFIGTCDIAYLPAEHVVGLSKFARLVDGYARRLQIQERLTNQIADAIVDEVVALGVAVRIRSKHSCMSMRGARHACASMATSAVRGVFLTDPIVRQEWLQSLPP